MDEKLLKGEQYYIIIKVCSLRNILPRVSTL